MSLAQINENPLSIQTSFLTKSTINALEEVELRINVDLAEKHHAYSKQFKVKTQIKNLKTRKLLINPEVEFFDNLAKKTKKGIKNKATITTSFEVPESLKPGQQKLEFALQYQACTKDYCLMPIDLPFLVEANVVNPNYKEPRSFSLTNINLDSTQTSLLSILLLIFLAGFLTSFTPCIYPMIPITLAVLGHSSHKQSISRKFFLSLSYVLGIALTYSALGVLAATTGGLFGSYLNHPYVRVGIGLLFVLMALSMFGVFQLQAPAFLRNKLTNKKFKQNYLGAFATGLVAGIIASPCVGPVLIGILTYVAQSGDLFVGFLYLFTFAMGLGVIFIVIGLFSHLIDKLPRSGSWMEATKFIFGAVMVGAAAYYLMPVFDRPFKYMIPILACSLCFHFAQKLIFQRTLKMIILSLLVGGMVLSSAMSMPGLNYKFKSLFTAKDPYAPDWTTYSPNIYDVAKKQNKGLIIDFYADWCAACIELEKKTFNTQKVQELTKNFIWVKYNATIQPKDYETVRKKYNIKGLPHIVFYDEQGSYRKELTLFGFEDEQRFIKRLIKLISK